MTSKSKPLYASRLASSALDAADETAKPLLALLLLPPPPPPPSSAAPAASAALSAAAAAAASDGAHYAPVRARWYVLAVFSSFAALQGWSWALPGPLASTLVAAYGVSPYGVQWMLNLGPLVFVATALPFAVWMDRAGSLGGLRGAVLASAGLTAAAAGARLASAADASPASLALLFLSCGLNAAAGPVSMSAVSKLSEAWFPPHERTLATSVPAETNGLGVALAFIVGPAFVAGAPEPLAALRGYYALLLALALATLLAAAAYFPSAPPRPPTRTAAASAAAGAAFTPAALAAALRGMAASRPFLLLLGVYTLGGGMYSGWSALLALNTAPLGVSEADAGSIGFWGTLVGNLAGIALGRVGDAVRAWRGLILGLNALAAVALLGFTLVVARAPPLGELPPRAALAALYATFTAASLSGALVGLYYEAAIDAVGVGAEATVITVMAVAYNVGSGAMLFIPVGASGAPMNAAFTAAQVALTIALAVGYADHRARLDVDEPEEAAAVAAGKAGAAGGEGEGEGGDAAAGASGLTTVKATA